MKNPKDVKCKVLRSFVWNEKPVAKGATLTLPYAFANEVLQAKKVEFVNDSPGGDGPEKPGK